MKARSCDTSIDIVNRATLNIYTCGACADPAEPGAEPAGPEDPTPRCPDGTGACVPYALGSKPKKPLEERLRPLLENNRIPSVLPAAFFQMARRFLDGREPANPLETSAFGVFRQLSADVRGVMRCALDTFDGFPATERDRLISAGFGTSPEQPVEPDRLAELLADELLERAKADAFGDEGACLDAERPGQVRVLTFSGDDVGSVVAVNVCRVNGFRTGSFSPSLSLAEYRTEELQQTCTPEVEDGEVVLNCQPQEEPCPGHAVEGVCLRVPEVLAGEGVVLEGVNFFDVSARVRLEAKGDTSIVREVDAHVCGDVDTPVTETVDGEARVIADCRVKDHITFEVPDDLPDGIYALTVIVPNGVGLEGFGDEFVSNPPQFIRVVPAPDETFQIASERLDCVLETAAPVFRNAGSDEIGLRSLAIPIGLDLTPGSVVERSFDFGDVDTGESRAMDRVLIQGSQLSGVALTLIGFEIDNRDVFEKQIRDFADAYVEILQTSWNAVAGALGGLAGLVAAAAGLSTSWVTAIAAAVTLAVQAFVAWWAPADLVIEDAAAFTRLDLGARTSPLLPAPPEVSFTSAGGVDVRVVPVSKGVAYVERREYRSNDQDSEYHVTLRYNRV